MTSSQSKDQSHETVKNYIKAFSNETRLNIFLLIIVRRDTTLDEICQFIGKSKSTVHHHVQILLDSGLVDEVTKPGSKTRYYRRVETNISKQVREAFSIDKFKAQTKERKWELSDLYETLHKTSNITMINTLQTLLDDYYLYLEENNVDKRYNQLGELMLGFFFLSEENAKKFREEHRELRKKYYEDERRNPERDKPYGFFYAGYDVEQVLKRKYKNKKNY
jgi:DNA-binding transcriptional ArsR family regulator